MDILFTIQNQRLRCKTSDVYVEGSHNYLEAVFDISDDWQGHTVTVFFQHAEDEEPVARFLDDALRCKVPTQVIKDGDLRVWVRGDTDDQIIPTNEVTLVIYSTGSLQPPPDEEYEADVYGQMIAIMQETTDVANEALETAKRAEEIAQGGGSGGGIYFEIDDSLTLEDDILRVNVTEVLETDSRLPVSSGAVQAAIDEANEAIEDKVDKVDGKVLSSNDFTNVLKEKLEGIEDGANKVVPISDERIDEICATTTEEEATIAIAEIVQSTGGRDDAVMSQAATTEALSAKLSANIGAENAFKLLYVDERGSLVPLILGDGLKIVGGVLTISNAHVVAAICGKALCGEIICGGV